MKNTTMKSLVIISLCAILAIFVSIAGIARQAEDPGVLLRAAIEKEEVDGDLQAAIDLYKKIVDKYGSQRAVAAKALVRLGGCYEKLGEKQASLAQKAFEKVIENYPDQADAVKTAKEKLSVLLRARAAIEKGGKEFKITKIHTDSRPGWLSPDGTKLALLDLEKDVLWLRDLGSGKETCLLPKAEMATDCFWSPDSRLIVYFTGTSSCFRMVSAEGGQPKTLLDIEPEMKKTGRYPWPTGWTSDSQKLIVQVSTFKTCEGVYALPVAGGSLEELYKFPDPQRAKERGEQLTLSPDGRFFAYSSRQNGNVDIYVMPVRGGEPVRITDDPADDSSPAWSYDGQWLAFRSTRSADSGTWVIGVTSDGRPSGRPIHATQGGDGGAWTKDGRIAYSTQTNKVRIFIAGTDGSQETCLTKLNDLNALPRWSPDGKTIAFVSRYGENREAVWTVPASGGDEKLLAHGNYPAWSPDGKMIAFTNERSRPGRPLLKTTISLIAAEGGEARQIMSYDGAVNYVDWSPDGRHLVFSYSRDALALDPVKDGKNIIPDSRENGEDVFIIPATGGTPKKVGPASESQGSWHSPRWSPDGKKIAFLLFGKEGAKEAGNLPGGLYTVDIEGGTPKLVTGENPRYWFCWSRDSKNIIYTQEPGDGSLYSVSADGGKPEKLNILGKSPDISPDGKKIAFYRIAKQPFEFWLVENFLPDGKKQK